MYVGCLVLGWGQYEDNMYILSKLLSIMKDIFLHAAWQHMH